MAWPTQFFTAGFFLAIGVIFWPEAFRLKSDGQNLPELYFFLKLVHLLSFSTAWGAALWVTFIGRIILFKNLPRHQFGNLRSKTIPAYFTLVAGCSIASVISFGYWHPWKLSTISEKYQLGYLISTFAFNMSNLVVLTPMIIEMMKQRHKIETESNSGEEVAGSKNVEVEKANPKLEAMIKKLWMIQGLSSLANIMSFGCLAMHSWYLAGKTNL